MNDEISLQLENIAAEIQLLEIELRFLNERLERYEKYTNAKTNNQPVTETTAAP
jgi:hypothetical protein